MNFTPEVPAEKSREEMINEYFDTLYERRHDCINELPDKLVEINDDPEKYHKYKCRTNWWASVNAALENMLFKGLVNDEVVKDEINAFFNYADNLDWSKFRTKEDLDEADRVLDMVMDYLENQKSK